MPWEYNIFMSFSRDFPFNFLISGENFNHGLYCINIHFLHLYKLSTYKKVRHQHSVYYSIGASCRGKMEKHCYAQKQDSPLWFFLLASYQISFWNTVSDKTTAYKQRPFINGLLYNLLMHKLAMLLRWWRCTTTSGSYTSAAMRCSRWESVQGVGHILVTICSCHMWPAWQATYGPSAATLYLSSGTICCDTWHPSVWSSIG